MNSQMILHCGGELATLDDLRDVPLPEVTASYHPVSHYDLVTRAARMARDLLGHTYALKKDSYALSREGSRMFFLLQYQNGHDELGLALAGRNSYDKSMSVGFTVGAAVFVCDNLALSGEVTYLRRHTPNVWDDLELRLLRTLYRAEHRFLRLVEDALAMKARPVESEEAYRTLGLLRGKGVLSGRQLNRALKAWRKPEHEAFASADVWRLYNACTEALKTTPVEKLLARHVALHEVIAQEYLADS